MVELMIAMVLSLLLGVAVVTVFVNNSYSFNQDENILRMQDDARYALQQLAYDVSMAGHYADLLVPGTVTPDASLAIGTDCGPPASLNWMYQTVDGGTGDSLSISATDNATSSSIAAVHSCIGSGELQDGTDVISIKRVAGGPSAALQSGSIYLRTNGTVGLLFRAPFPVAPAITIDPPRADWAYRPRIYYIRSFANTVGDNIPTLCRKVLSGAVPSVTTECIATGIENLQIEYGIDTSNDGNANVFLASPTLAELERVVSARIFLLARTGEMDVKYTNAKSFSISNSPVYTPNDSFHRRVFSTTVAIQNVRSMNLMDPS